MLSSTISTLIGGTLPFSKPDFDCKADCIAGFSIFFVFLARADGRGEATRGGGVVVCSGAGGGDEMVDGGAAWVGWSVEVPEWVLEREGLVA